MRSSADHGRSASPHELYYAQPGAQLRVNSRVGHWFPMVEALADRKSIARHKLRALVENKSAITSSLRAFES